ncbi:MAG: hypothetical protein L0Z50_02865, partial [Verrucomicrobiales bacterium]|nr:hypothetical protein [Verrucomicrobiales bacterium]
DLNSSNNTRSNILPALHTRPLPNWMGSGRGRAMHCHGNARTAGHRGQSAGSLSCPDRSAMPATPPVAFCCRSGIGPADDGNYQLKPVERRPGPQIDVVGQFLGGTGRGDTMVMIGGIPASPLRPARLIPTGGSKLDGKKKKSLNDLFV